MVESSPVSPVSPREARFRQIALVVLRLALGYLFFAALWWKQPPQFGCPVSPTGEFQFTTGTPQRLSRTTGLCDWLGIQSVWATAPHPILDSGLGVALPIDPLARLNGLFVDNVIIPGFPASGYFIWLLEAFIAVSLLLGLFTRLGALAALAQATQLLIGLGGIDNPPEWEWSYILMILAALVVLAFAPGRRFGLDAGLRPRLRAAAESGSRLARAALFAT
jgi:uncharacterized membrane protein YphA (DoxX/SURF4 family)